MKFRKNKKYNSTKDLLLKKARLYLPALAMICLMTFMACTDDKLDVSGSSSDEWVDDGEGKVLEFAVNLTGSQSGTRDDVSPQGNIEDEYDSKVDESNMRVLIFGANGEFLFESTNRIVTKAPDNNGQWFVRIPLNNQIKDDNNKSILGDVRNYLENNSFKVAVLANWPSNQPQWGWNNSALNVNAEYKKNVNDLHHLENGYYAKQTGTYSFILKDSKSGVRKDWVTSTLNLENLGKRVGAEDYIRKNWIPKGQQTDDFLKKYFNLWQVWNLGGAYEDTAIPYDKMSLKKDDREKKLEEVTEFLPNTHIESWNELSGAIFKSWLGEGNDVTGIDNNTQLTVSQSAVNGIWFEAYDPNDKTPEENKVSHPYHKDNYHGVALGLTNHFVQDDSGNYNLEINNHNSVGYIMFKAPASGILRINWSSSEEGKNAKFALNRESNSLGNSSNYNSTAPKQYYKEISITQDPERIFIYTVSETPVVIYSIEYICDQYLYDTDRQGVVNQLIPMYGIQNFPKIDNWGEVEVLNLSQNGKYVDLVRSVAKVELYLNEEIPSHYVQMRSMNRTSFSEPMDVETPTYTGWTRHTGTSFHDSDHCEWFDLVNYGHGYGNTTDTYQNWLSYFYGSWKYNYDVTDESQDNKTEDEWSWNFGTSVTVPSGKYYPHIFNPSIDRSDFCEFVYKGKDNNTGMYRYMLYVPDKFIDDPNEVGNLSSTPKVMHIEFRKGDNNNTEQYLDDNNCHRLYFTDYKNNPTINDLYADEFDDYEKTGLNDLWPVMRNHIYRFYVNRNAQTVEVLVKVSDFEVHSSIKREEW